MTTPDEQIEILEKRLRYLKGIVDKMSENPLAVAAGVKKFEEAFVAWQMSDMEREEVLSVFNDLYAFMVKTVDHKEIYVKYARAVISVHEGRQGLNFRSQYTPADDPAEAFFDTHTKEFKFSRLTWNKLSSCALAAKYYMARQSNS